MMIIKHGWERAKKEKEKINKARKKNEYHGN